MEVLAARCAVRKTSRHDNGVADPGTLRASMKDAASVMDFFAAQAHAHRNTRVLIGLFALAVLVIAALTNLALILAASLIDPVGFFGFGVFNWEKLVYVTVFVTAVICAGSLVRIVSLRRGGAAVAESLAGRLVVHGQTDLSRRRLLNVVEEMSIASGIPVPQVYVIPDDAINAFAAGYEPGDAVVAVTQGALDQLGRAELQGVVAHEFSHIVNGDMRLNMHMIGLLYGIYMLSVVGRTIVGGGETRRTSRVSGGYFILGAMLFIIGSLGQLLGGLIKAALGRQREFLADASAAQFTRNPRGIADALKRIGGHPLGARVEDPRSVEVSHAFFAESIGLSYLKSKLLATHPPLGERIKRLDPAWNGEFLLNVSQQEPEGATMLAPAMPLSAESTRSAGSTGSSRPSTPEPDVLASIGQAGDLGQTRSLIAGLPRMLAQGVHDPYLARSVIYLLLLDEEAGIRELQLAELRASDQDAAQAMVPLLASLPILSGSKLMLIEMAIPALRQLTPCQYDQFRAAIDALIRANRSISMSEWSLQRLVTASLGPMFGQRRHRQPHRTIEGCRDECAMLLSMLVFSGRQHRLSREQAFDAGRKVLSVEMSLVPAQALSLAALDEAVSRLAELKPLRKPRLLKACVATIVADGAVTPVESMLIRSVAAVLDCPMPPIVANPAD